MNERMTLQIRDAPVKMSPDGLARGSWTRSSYAPGTLSVLPTPPSQTISSATSNWLSELLKVSSGRQRRREALPFRENYFKIQ